MTALWHGRKGRPWRRLREMVLARDPVCTICWRRPATTVDHVVPLSVRPDLAHVVSNLRGACASCNAAGGAALINGRHSRRPRRINSREW